MDDLNDDSASWKAVTESQVVLVLVGLIGSGKSTFAQALERDVPQFRRCNQDDLGDRQSVERLARQCLRDGLSVVVDRTNFDEAQRVHWVRIAQEVPGTKLWCIVFDTPYDVCQERLAYRVGHPTLQSPERAMEVLAHFHLMLTQPSQDEGFQRIFHLDLSSQSQEYSALDLQNILLRVESSPALAPQRSIREYFRPQGGRGSGASGGFRGRSRRPSGSHSGGIVGSSFAPQDTTPWRRGYGYGRGLPLHSFSDTRVGGERGSWKDITEHASSSLRGGRPFGGRPLVRGAGVTAQFGADHAGAWRRPISANSSISQEQVHQRRESSTDGAGQTHEPADSAQ